MRETDRPFDPVFGVCWAHRQTVGESSQSMDTYFPNTPDELSSMTPLSLRSLIWTQLLASIAGAQARTTLVVVDDADTDRISYSKGWNPGNECAGCSAQPDKSKPINGTWHDGTESADRLDEVFFTFTFTGTSVEVRHIAIDLVNDWTTNTNVSYSIDSTPRGVVQRDPANQTDYLYNQVLFQLDGLPNVEHTLRVDLQRPGVLLLDYLTYTAENVDVKGTSGSSSSAVSSPSSSPTSSSSSKNTNVAIITGTVLPGVAILIVVGCIYWYRVKRRREREQARLAPAPKVTQVPPWNHPYPSTELGGQALYNIPPAERAGAGGDHPLLTSSQHNIAVYYSGPPVSPEVSHHISPTTLDTSKGSSIPVSRPSPPPQLSRVRSSGGRVHIIVEEQEVSSRRYTSSTLPPPYNPNTD